LLAAAGFKDRIPDAGEVGFRIAPAINASGRMDSAGQAVRMFLTADPDEAAAIAHELFALNQERQTAERAVVNAIFAQCAETPVTDTDAALVFWGEGWHRGVVGIVASRVVNKFHRPAIVLGVENGVAQGSGRSIEAFHLLDALESMRDLFTRFGGHAHAAGLTLPSDSLEAFRERMRVYAVAALTPEDMCPSVTLRSARRATSRTAPNLERKAPQGSRKTGNPNRHHEGLEHGRKGRRNRRNGVNGYRVRNRERLVQRLEPDSKRIPMLCKVSLLCGVGLRPAL
jgi:single-stranded-DNA-specific exonuclease